MIHLLTMGHFTPGNPKTAKVEGPLDMAVVGRLLSELGVLDAKGKPTLDGMPVKLKDGVVAAHWKAGRYRNRAAEEFALRLQAETGRAICGSRAFPGDRARSSGRRRQSRGGAGRKVSGETGRLRRPSARGILKADRARPRGTRPPPTPPGVVPDEAT